MISSTRMSNKNLPTPTLTLPLILEWSYDNPQAVCCNLWIKVGFGRWALTEKPLTMLRTNIFKLWCATSTTPKLMSFIWFKCVMLSSLYMALWLPRHPHEQWTAGQKFYGPQKPHRYGKIVWVRNRAGTNGNAGLRSLRSLLPTSFSGGKKKKKTKEKEQEWVMGTLWYSSQKNVLFLHTWILTMREF